MSVARLPLPSAAKPGDVARVDLPLGGAPAVVVDPGSGRGVLLVRPGDRAAFRARRAPWYRRVLGRLTGRPVEVEWRFLLGAARSGVVLGQRVYARSAVRYRGDHVVHKGGRGTVVHVLGGVPYVRWDWTDETFPVSARQLGALP